MEFNEQALPTLLACDKLSGLNVCVHCFSNRLTFNRQSFKYIVQTHVLQIWHIWYFSHIEAIICGFDIIVSRI
jgi:hypothetical protein